MGEPLYFVLGGEKLFKNYLKEILAILCTGEGGFERRNRWASWVAVDYLLYLGGEGWGIGAESNHMTSLACAKPTRFYRSPNAGALPL